jgi:hypothetical protein
MRIKIVALALTAGAGLVAPGIALAADSATSGTSSAVDRAAQRLSSINDALKGLVTDGSITQTQADEVAATLSASDALRGGPHGPGGRGHHGHHGPRGGHVSPEATAKVLGVTVEELRTAQQAGRTLAQIAAAEGVSKADLISGLVAAAKTQLAADVEAGTVTQAQADEIAGTLTARITEKVDRVRLARPERSEPKAATPSAASTA